jgi:hypothetical protein
VIEHGEDGAIAHTLELSLGVAVETLGVLVIAGETGLIAEAPQQQARLAIDRAPDYPMAPPRPPKSNSAASR